VSHGANRGRNYGGQKRRNAGPQHRVAIGILMAKHKVTGEGTITLLRTGVST
jgi:hypothetical protein